MKRNLIKLQALAMAGAMIAVPRLTRADQFIWSGASGSDLNWATPGNWNPAGPPGTNDDAQFFDAGASSDTTTIDNIVAADRTVQSVWFAQTNGVHNTQIDPGVTWTIAGDNALGNFASFENASSSNNPAAFLVGTLDYADVTTTVSNTVSGAGGSLFVNNTNNMLIIRQGHGSSGNHVATLDLSGLDSFSADLDAIQIGHGDTTYRRAVGTLLLAKTNMITVRGSDGSPGILVGDNQGNNNGNGSRSYIYLGQDNTINADWIRIGGQKQQGAMFFEDGLTAPTLKMRGSDGVGRVANFGIGDEHHQGGSGNPTTGEVTLTNGTVDILADTVDVGHSQTGTGATATGLLTLGNGTLDVNTLDIAYEDTADNTRTYSVEGTATFDGTDVTVNNLLRLGREGGAAASQNATLVINGGTLTTPNLSVESTNCTVSITGGGSLSVTNVKDTFGSAGMPLEEFDLTDSTLTIPGNAGEIVATTFNGGGATSKINISSVPRISAYPAQIPLIQYTYSDGMVPSLGSLPTATPPYQGSLSNDYLGNIYLVLSDGPVSVTLDWTGAASGDWDTTSVNWTKSGNPVAYTPGDPVQFDDSATGETNVNLTTALAPSAITVTNSAKDYTFAGPGSLTGGTGIDKEGSGTLKIANEGVNDFNGPINIGGGTLQVGDGSTNGNIPDVPVTDEGNLVFNSSNDSTLNSAISGSGSITKLGTGHQTLGGDLTSFTGPSEVDGGTLTIGGTYYNGGPITVGAGGRLASAPGTSAYFSSPITSSGQVDPGGDGEPASLDAASLTLNSGGTLKFDFTDNPNGIPNDSLIVDSTLTLNNNRIIVGFLGQPVTGTPYLIVTAGGISGSFNPSVGGTHYTATLDTTTAPNSVYITFSGSGANMKWASTTDGIWNSTASNWLNQATSAMEPFYGGDSALFDDSVSGVVTNITIPENAVIGATAVTVDSSANDYTIGGAGSIGGIANIVKKGTSTLTLNTGNSFSGTVDIQAGTLKVGSGSALGTTDNGTTIEPGATLDVNGQNVENEDITAGGAGVNGQGAIINSGSDQVHAIGTVTVTGDITFGGTGRWDIRGGGPALNASAPYNITKVGTNQVSLVGATVDGNLRNVDVKEGTFAIQTSTVQNSGGFGDPAGVITVYTNALVDFYALDVGGTNPLDKVFDIQGGGTLWSDSGTTTLIGPITTEGNGIILCDGGTTLNVSNVISGAGGITKTGGGTLNLANGNTYTGDTVISGGTVALLGSTSISDSANVMLDGGTLDASAAGTFTLASGQTLGGSGNLTGNLVSGSGTTVAPGNPTGTLTVSGDVALGGSTVVCVDSANSANGKLSAANITFGGTLTVTNIGPIYGTNVFDLFDGTLSQTFANVELPTISGVTWDTSNLYTDGTIMAIGPAPVGPVNIGISVSGNQLNLSWPSENTGWSLQVQTNDLSAGLSTNWYDVTGSTTTNGMTVTIDPSAPVVFYRLVAP